MFRQFKPIKVDIESKFQIFKVGLRVFWIGDTDIDNFFSNFKPLVFDFISILILMLSVPIVKFLENLARKLDTF